jgi:hypothetical protein
MALLEKAAGQGHAWAMFALENVHSKRNEHEQGVKWARKAAEAGLPRAFFTLGLYLDLGVGLAAPDYPEAADWFRRSADAGDTAASNGHVAANILAGMYAVGRGLAWHMMPVTSSSTL